MNYKEEMLSKEIIKGWCMVCVLDRSISVSRAVLLMMIGMMLFLSSESVGQEIRSSGGFEIMNKGILIPRMSADDRMMMDPIDGLMVYDSTLDRFFYYSNVSMAWRRLNVESGSASSLLISAMTIQNGTIPHQPSTASYWDIGGNIGANRFYSDPPLLGNVDDTPFILITNDIERMRLREDGNIQMARSLEIGENLLVKQNVELNTDGGETVNYGPLTVERASPTYLTGILTVDSTSRLKSAVYMNDDGGATVNYGPLTVDRASPTYLTGILTVDSTSRLKSDVYMNEDGGETANYGPLTVDRASPTYLTGILTVDSTSRLKSDVYMNEDGGATVNYGPLTVDRASPTYLTGIITVDSTSRLKSDVYMNEDGGETVNYGPLTVNRASPTYLTGILTVDSTSRLKSDVYMNEDGGTTVNYGPLTVDRASPTYLTGILTVDSISRLKSDVYLNETSGETVINGPFTVDRKSPTIFSGTLTIDSLVKLRSDTKVFGGTVLHGPLIVEDLNTSQFTGPVNITNRTPSDSAMTDTGALVVYGGVGIGQNINIDSNMVVAGRAIFGGEVGFTKPVTISAPEQSTNTSSGALVVTGGTGIGRRLNVGGAVRLDSILNVTGPTTFNSTLDVTGPTTFNSTLDVTGPTTFDSTLTVMNSSVLGGTLDIKGITKITSSAMSSSIGSGALKISGGIGIAKNLNVGGSLNVNKMARLGNSLTVNSGTTLGNSLTVNLGTTLGNSLTVNSGTTLGNSLTVDLNSALEGRLNISGNDTIGGYMKVTKSAVIDGFLTNSGTSSFGEGLLVESKSAYIAEFENSSNNNGIEIRLDGGSDTSHYFITFLKNDGTPIGKIQAESYRDFEANVRNESIDLIFRLYDSYDFKADLAAFEVATAAALFGIAGFTAYNYSIGATACTGTGACVTAPVASFVVAAYFETAARAADLVAATIGLVKAEEYRSEYSAQSRLDKRRVFSTGVIYQSGSADYAEWLPKLNSTEDFLPGYIVGMRQGKISLLTQGADKILAISTNPIVLGNMPPEGAEGGYEKVAFMGQVPVYVTGRVEMGDYILASGRDDGLGIAIAPSAMKAEDYSRVVGMAWSASTSDIYSMINVAIGLNDGDVSRLVADQQSDLEKLQADLERLQRRRAERKKVLARLVPGYGEAMGIDEEDLIITASGAQYRDSYGLVDEIVEINSGEPTTIIYYKITREQILDGLKLAESFYEENKGALSDNPFWSKMSSDPVYREGVIQKIEKSMDGTMHVHKQINAEGGHRH